MKSNNLTISLPGDYCNKNCPYCISKITPVVNDASTLDFKRKLDKVKAIANKAGVSNLLITGKGETITGYDTNNNLLLSLINKFTDNFIMEIQTNGVFLSSLSKTKFEEYYLNYLKGIDIIAFSIDKKDDLFKLSDKIIKLSLDGVVVRLCINVSPLWDEYGDISVKNIIEDCKILGVKQLLFRRISLPSNSNNNTPQEKWINDNLRGIGDMYSSIINEITTLDKTKVRVIPSIGSTVYDVDGISLLTSRYCIQEQTTDENIRSLIYMGDGHMYTSWNSSASILF